MLLGIDLGTSAIKVSLFDPAGGRLIASATSDGEIPRSAPEPNWCEQDPEDWWAATLQALSKLPADSRQKVTAIGISYQMHGLVLLGDDGKPVRPSIIWSDGRAVSSGTALADEVDWKPLLNRPGNFTMAKLRWVRDHEGDLKPWKAMLPGDYLAYRLSGDAVTTTTGLSEMIAWDFVAQAPCNQIWERAWSASLMPDLVPIFGDQGRVTPAAAGETGLPAGARICYRAGDQPNNALSLNVFHPGELAAVAGTSGVLYGVTDQPTLDPQERVNTFLHVNDQPDQSRLGVLLCVNGAGGFYSWVRRLLGVASFDELNGLAAGSQPGANGVVAIPYGNGPERSLGNRNPGAGFSNVDVNRHGREDVARAAMEGIVFAMRYGADVLGEMGLRTSVVKAGDGSMFKSELFQKIFATVIGAELQILETDGSLGAARAAGVGSGTFRNLEEAFRTLRVLKQVSPESWDYESVYQKWRDAAI